MIRPISDGLVAQANLIGAVIGQNLCAGVINLYNWTVDMHWNRPWRNGCECVCVGGGGGGGGRGTGMGLMRKRNENSDGLQT